VKVSTDMRGTMWVLASAAAYAVSAMLVRALSHVFDAGMQNLSRQIVALLILLPAIIRTPRLLTEFSDRRLMIFRSVAQSVGLVLTYYSFQTIPLLDATVLSFSRILWIYVLAAIFLHERLTKASFAAMALGTIGCLVTVRPGAMDFTQGHAAALVGAFVMATTNVSVARLAQDTSLTTLLAWTAITGIVMTGPFAMFSDWPVASPWQVVLLVLAGAAAILSQLAFIIGVRTGRGTTVATADYARLPFAALLAYVCFREQPSLAAVVGGLLIVAASFIPSLWRVRPIAP
jgi:drug/metabolite transporter (DMT)-like permease